jgi:hypothetical protein
VALQWFLSKKVSKKRWSVCPSLPVGGGPLAARVAVERSGAEWSLSFKSHASFSFLSHRNTPEILDAFTFSLPSLAGVSGPPPSGQGPLKNGRFSKHGMACVGAAVAFILAMTPVQYQVRSIVLSTEYSILQYSPLVHGGRADHRL